MRNANDGSLQDMFFLVVPDFMCQHCYYFRNSMLRYQGVEKRDAFVAAEPGEESVRFTRSSGTIHDEDIFDWEIY